jgi:hypothetical protein
MTGLQEDLNALEDMASQVLDNAILRALCATGETPASLSDSRRLGLLESNEEARKSYRAQLR